MNNLQIKKVLLVEHNLADARLIIEMFQHQGSYSFTIAHVESLAQADTYLSNHSMDAILLDLDCPDVQGEDAILQIHSAAKATAIVLLADPLNELIASLSLDNGVQDYLIKGAIEPRELMRSLRNSIARKVLEERLFFEKNRAQITLNCIGDAVICTDNAGNISFLNPVAERMTGWTLKEATGHPLAESFRIMDATTGMTAADPTSGSHDHGRASNLPVNCILTRRDGHQIFIEDSVAPVLDGNGLEAGSVLVFRDVTAARSQAEKITHLAEHDSLTGLPNRLLLNDRLDQAIARSQRKANLMAVLYLDLDGFKHINDSLGHSTGDQLLQSVAERLQGCVRSPDTVSRQGGDEFIILLHDTHHAEHAAITAKRLLRAVAIPHIINDRELNITGSIGISIYPNDGTDSETLIKNADIAMYKAKEGGRQNFRFFTTEMNINAVERLSMEEDLRHAIERHEFTLHYQPVISVHTGLLIGAEALLRWRHPTRQQVDPSVFIPVAEECGLILPIGCWVLREACTQAKKWMEEGLPPIIMAVNVSANQFRNDDFLEEVFDILKDTRLCPEYLNLEITEGVLMNRAKIGASILEKLRERGMLVSIDDFGIGYSSLSYLQNYPLDVLKIDQSFIRQISANPGNTSIVSAIISMGKSLNLRVLAEGVESLQDLTFLKEHQCDEAQGFYFSKALCATDFGNLRTQKNDRFIS